MRKAYRPKTRQKEKRYDEVGERGEPAGLKGDECAYTQQQRHYYSYLHGALVARVSSSREGALMLLGRGLEFLSLWLLGEEAGLSRGSACQKPRKIPKNCRKNRPPLQLHQPVHDDGRVVLLAREALVVIL